MLMYGGGSVVPMAVMSRRVRLVRASSEVEAATSLAVRVVT